MNCWTRAFTTKQFGTCTKHFSHHGRSIPNQKARHSWFLYREKEHVMKCHECGGSDLQGSCVCSYEFPPESNLVQEQPKQICHFCGVDLFLPRTDLNIRMCVPCGLALNHEECCKCIVCDKTWLMDECVGVPSGSVCESCRSL